MPILIALSIFIQIVCAIHVVKTGRDRTWLWLILAFSFIGCLIYFWVEMWPDLRRSHASKKVTNQVLKTLDPYRDLKHLARQLEISDNVENKVKLAQECVTEELYEEAIDLYNSALTGTYQDDPNIMLGLAISLFYNGNYAETKGTLTRLIERNPEFKSQEGHLLFARTLEALQENEGALEEYEVLASYYSGYEAKCRYALLLKKLGHTEKADRLFKEIITRSQQVPKKYSKAQKQWIDIASQQL